MNKVLVILGPTATGKTDLALRLAKKFNGELIAADSRQVYKGLDIGTGKIPGGGKWEVRGGSKMWEVGGIKIWMYDVVDLKKQYTVADYVNDASRVIRDIEKRGKLPVIVGGTGLYLKALLEGLSNLSIPVDKKIRGELEKLSLAELQGKLKTLSPIKWKKLNQSDRQNSRRLLRSIEIIMMNPYINLRDKIQETRYKYDVLKIGLTAQKEILYKNADLRVLDWIKQGIIDEARRLKEQTSGKRLRELGLEYGVLAEYLDGQITENTLVKIIQGKVHGYIKRQQTWFKKEKNINWFDITENNYLERIEKLLYKWYYSANDKKN